MKISGRRSQNTHFFLVSVRYPCVSLTRFLVDVASIIEMEEIFLLDNCSNVYQETCEAYARIPRRYQEKLRVLRRRCKDEGKWPWTSQVAVRLRWLCTPTGCELLQAASYRLQAAGYRLQAAGCRLQVAGYRLQASSYRLQATENTHFHNCKTEGS